MLGFSGPINLGGYLCYMTVRLTPTVICTWVNGDIIENPY